MDRQATLDALHALTTANPEVATEIAMLALGLSAVTVAGPDRVGREAVADMFRAFDDEQLSAFTRNALELAEVALEERCQREGTTLGRLLDEVATRDEGAPT